MLEITYRGVAQLIARSVWDREVEGLSPFTPTIVKAHAFVSFYYFQINSTDKIVGLNVYLCHNK